MAHPQDDNQAESTQAHPFLGRELRIELQDGRVIVGTLVAYEGSGDLLLQGAIEERHYKDGELAIRGMNLLAIPFKHVRALHRRVEGADPIMMPGEGALPATA